MHVGVRVYTGVDVSFVSRQNQKEENKIKSKQAGPIRKRGGDLILHELLASPFRRAQRGEECMQLEQTG